MKKNLQTKLENYKASISQKESIPNFKKIGLSSAAALAAIVMAPVELTSQVVCGNMGAPTRTIGACDGDLVFASLYNCAKFDFDGDGINELQIYYYNNFGVGSTAYGYIDPIQNNLASFGKGDHTFSFTFPGNPQLQTWAYYQKYQDRIYVMPLTGGNGYGFITFDSAAHPPGTSHPNTGQPICCFTTALPTMWGAQTGISSLSDITIESGDMDECPTFPVVPVELSRFEVEANEKSITLNWATESEVNNSGFSIERSTDGKNFSEIRFVEGVGNSSKTEEYRYQDYNINEGVNYYYRLNQIDYDGKNDYSIVRLGSVESTKSEVTIAPNPASGVVEIELDAKFDGTSTISILNTNGKSVREEIQEMALGRNKISLDLDNLAAGIYYVKVADGKDIQFKKLVVQ